MTHLLLWLLIATVSSFVQTVCGFGFAVFAMAFLPLLNGNVLLSSAICTVVAVWCSVGNAIRYRKGVNIRIILPCLVGFFVAHPILTRVALGLPTTIIKIILGFLLFLIAILFLFIAKSIQMKASIGCGLSMGLLSGTFGGLCGISGPPIAIYLLCVKKDMEEYLGSAAVFFIFISVYSTIVRASMGIFTREALPYIGVGSIGLLAGFFCGQYVASHVNGKLMQRYIYSFIGFTGLWYILSAFLSMR